MNVVRGFALAEFYCPVEFSAAVTAVTVRDGLWS
jgi:hypothetical protein